MISYLINKMNDATAFMVLNRMRLVIFSSNKHVFNYKHGRFPLLRLESRYNWKKKTLKYNVYKQHLSWRMISNFFFLVRRTR